MIVKLPKTYTILCCIAAVIACQRYLDIVYLYACVVPYFLSIFYFKNAKLRNSFLIISLFLCVDNGAAFSSLTHSLVRYPIYLTAFFALLYNSIYSLKKIVLFLIIISIPVILTLVNFSGISFGVLVRDLQLTLLAAAIVCKSKNGNSFPIDMKLVAMVLLLFLCMEVINIVATNAFSSQRYLNYSSSKSLIVLPALYFMRKNKIFQFVVVFFITALVLIPYGTRMIILSFVLVSIIGIIRAKWVNPLFIVGLFVSITATYFVLEANDIQLEGFKATGVFIQLLGEGNILDKIKLIDPIRFGETELFFSRNFFRILIGDGFGAGLHDANNVLFFVTDNDTAFSEAELNSKMFYNLHDTWIDLGLRFGLVLILLIYTLIIKGIISKDRDKSFYGKLLFVLFSCATFSFQGLIIIAFVWQHFVLLNHKEACVEKDKTNLAFG